MALALDRLGPGAVVTQWTAQPLVIALVVALAACYGYGVRRLDGAWPVRRTTIFTVGLVVLLWVSCGPAEVYHDALYWVWTAQTLVLWLAIPMLLLFGQPVQLARAIAGADGRLERALRSRPARVISNPLVGPALVPILSFALFFGPLAGWAITYEPVGWLLQLVLLVIGGLMVSPLVGLEENATSLAVGFSLVIGSFELVLDAVPGIVLRLSTHQVTSWFDHRATYGWSPRPLHDQQFAGGVLWTVAEVIDLPFLYLVFRRWIRADARDAARVDAVLEAERASRAGLDADAPEADLDRDVPWWVSDPAMQERLRRQG